MASFTAIAFSNSTMLSRLVAEPPFRILFRTLFKCLPVSVETRALWEISPRPAYLLGLLNGAKLAKNKGVSEICAVEFGVAGGDQRHRSERYAAHTFPP